MEQQQINALDTIRGKVGTHYDLANEIENLGFYVLADTDNNELSLVFLKGCWNPDGSDIEVAQIVGDSEATII